jgi:hypothetical protein
MNSFHSAMPITKKLMSGLLTSSGDLFAVVNVEAKLDR